MKNKANKKSKGVAFDIIMAILAFFPYIVLCVWDWIIKFFYSIPKESKAEHKIKGLIRLGVSIALFMVLTPHQNGYSLAQGELVKSYFTNFMGDSLGGVIFVGIEIALFLAILISFLVFIGMNTAENEPLYADTYRSKNDGGEYPKLHRIIKNLDNQFTGGARASDLLDYLKKGLK